MRKRTYLALVLCTFGAAIQSLAAADQKPFRVSLPGKSWALEIEMPGFHPETNKLMPDGRWYLLGTGANGIVLSIYLEKTSKPVSMDGCRKSVKERKSFASRLNLKPTDFHESQAGEMAVLEYIVHEVNGTAVQQKSVFACLAKEDVYADVHLSHMPFKPEDDALFASILSTVRIVDLAGSPQGSLGYFKEGSAYYIQGQFAKAIPAYQKALDLEKQDRKLDTNVWRVLVDNLGMAYGISGDLKSAEDVLSYGISMDPKYPMFYYNMACVSAERNDLDGTIQYLTTAFGYKSNMIPGEAMPDPRKDDSFQRFLNNERFRKLVDSVSAPAR